MEELNVYDLMKSMEIREYLRTHKVFTPLEQGQIIVKSYHPIEEKILMLHQLAAQISGDDKTVIEETAEMLSAALEEIYHPVEKVLYALTIYSAGRFLALDEHNIFQKDHGISGVYNSFGDMVKECDDNEEKESVLYYADVIKASDCGPSEIIMDVWMVYMDGRFRIWHIFVGEEWAKEHGITRDTIDFLLDSNFRYSLPFKYGSRVKIRTPLMNKPIYGSMYSSRDGNACWYHFFERNQNGHCISLDLSYGTLGLGGLFLVFDWLESAGEDKMPDIMDSFNEALLYKRIVPISEIKRCGAYVIAGEVTEVEVVERESIKGGTEEVFRVTVEDGTGSISGYLVLDPSDKNCITELWETREKVILSGIFSEDEKGQLYMEYDVDTYMIP